MPRSLQECAVKEGIKEDKALNAGVSIWYIIKWKRELSLLVYFSEAQIQMQPHS